MKKLLLSTMMVALTTVPAVAQTAEPMPVPPAAETPAPTEDMAVDPKAGWLPVDIASVPVEELEGVVVYDSENANVGEVATVVTADDGRATTVVIDVGGFLGLGEKPVALPVEDLEILRAENGFDLQVNVSLTRKQLDAMPEYEG